MRSAYTTWNFAEFLVIGYSCYLTYAKCMLLTHELAVDLAPLLRVEGMQVLHSRDVDVVSVCVDDHSLAAMRVLSSRFLQSTLAAFRTRILRRWRFGRMTVSHHSAGICLNTEEVYFVIKSLTQSAQCLQSKTCSQNRCVESSLKVAQPIVPRSFHTKS